MATDKPFRPGPGIVLILNPAASARIRLHHHLVSMPREIFHLGGNHGHTIFIAFNFFR
jgi:hypothetical protein